jgi:hypothetical protein
VSEIDNQPPLCPTCSNYLEWVQCDVCCGDGYFDSDELMELDPLWYSDGDIEDCEDCHGKGGDWHCDSCNEFKILPRKERQP